MDKITAVFLGVFLLFIILLVIKQAAKLRFCVLCASVFLTWLFLLVIYWLKWFDEPLLVAILMGESTLGIYYLFEKRVAENYQIFRLPFLLTLVYIAFSLLTLKINLQPLLFLLILWALFSLLYIYRSNLKMKKIVDKIIACCKDW